MKVVRQLNHSIVVEDDDSDLIERLIRMLDEHAEGMRIVTADGQEIQLPESVISAVAEVARVIANGDAAVVLPMQSELSPEQASRVLNVSRPYVARLLDQGVIPFHRVGSHRRVLLSDLLAYKERRDATRREELRRMSEMSREMGIPE